ncbi:MAG: hypothetical protein COA58_13215 [Bacteroidetes bacterium]|nr:MAG: hypothetical protein COA58_13215 [Bacteroidota bacterium]
MKQTKNIILAFILLFSIGSFVGCSNSDDIPEQDDKTTECDLRGTIVGLDCVGQSLGIMDSKGHFYFIETDRTGDFSKYKEGDSICFSYVDCDDCIRTFNTQNIINTPALPIDLTCINDCGCTNNDCKGVTEVRQLQKDSLRDNLMNVIDIKQNGNSLTIKIAFSGCDDKIDPSLFVAQDLKVMSPTPWYNCEVKTNRIQLCQAYFTREICFDLTPLTRKYSDFNMNFHTQSGIKTIHIKR